MGVAKHVPETIAKYRKMYLVLCQKAHCLELSFTSTVAKSRHWSGANLRKARDALRCRWAFTGIAAQGPVELRACKTEPTPAVDHKARITGAGKGTRTLTMSPPADFESAASTSSAIPARSALSMKPLAPSKGTSTRTPSRRRFCASGVHIVAHWCLALMRLAWMAGPARPTLPADIIGR